MTLTPLQFRPQFKDKLWGGQKIRTVLNKDFGTLPNCGESWELSGVPGNVSVVADGPLAGRDLVSLIDEFKGDLVGPPVYERFGTDFPLLIKFLDAADDLSIQVHPDDELARTRHDSFGKTEMWYIMQADAGATLNSGFKREVSKDEYVRAVEDGTLMDLLNIEPVGTGDVFFLPAGRVHYIGKGILLAEIQQTSDITYRIYDFDRVDDKGQKRELHTEQAVDAIDFTVHPDYKTRYEERSNEATTLVDCPYFTTNRLHLTEPLARDYFGLDSFVIYIVLEGTGTLTTETGDTPLIQGQTLLLPNALKKATLVPEGELLLLEVYVS
jgi:mannose-6-phosphate isomerase